MKIPFVAFAEQNKNVYEAFLDYWKHFRAQEGDARYKDTYKESIDRNGQMVKISFAEKEAQMNDMFKAEILRVAGFSNLSEFPLSTYASNPQLVWATFAVVQAMIDMVLPQTIIDSIGLFTDVQSGGFGDSFAFDISPRDIFTVSKAGRNQRTSEIHKQEKGQVVIFPENHMITVGVSLYRVLAGKESLASFVMKAVRAMESQMAYECYSLFATTMAALDNAGDDLLRVAGYTQSDLISLNQKVSAWNSSKSIVVGTNLALANVLPADANYRYDLDTSEYVKLGHMRSAFGYDFLELAQLADWRTPFKLLLDDAKLWIVSPGAKKIVKLCIEGNTISNTTGPFDAKNLSQETTIMKSWGVGVATNSVAAVITL